VPAEIKLSSLSLSVVTMPLATKLVENTILKMATENIVLSIAGSFQTVKSKKQL
jgi:hypothetical protein